ncbi:UDP-4-amino-4,6-dideoxy-N-acetyl-beta-L-altrosamine transaminase [Pseudovibrio denitrificans]|uniref:UDP-4-amino-4,6-dideoxy-N-acetyl-beta-L-altrosamine transaminase n=1 Tax=Pseudovibrio denitrificans TaxID=258256 RepID=A0A1I7CTQ8_9HYPH|nr:UDP-4-amino-4,6-dideoxy-N-acetyl-beta-L-altrosamine transaminase [Pseudovibrio denitrificans]SFU02837.1 UDP-4-amino-4,6-dideoxy-N-acetyl-beta-L-altrosamine transaminase [Pseudovibrio denitrificans]
MLPYGRQSICQADIDEVTRVLKGDFLTTGPEVPSFESAFASYVDVPFAVACANGTAALHLVSLALGLKPGDQVIVPTMSFVATANGPHYCGADIIFADVDPDSGLVTADTIKEALTRADLDRLKAIFVVHLTGASVDMTGISDLAREVSVPLVEDACHAVGSNYLLSSEARGRVGDCQLSDFAVFSFHPVKTITCGEGGMITTRSEEYASRLKLLRNHGLIRDSNQWVDERLGCDEVTGEVNPWVYELQVLGYNYRLTDFQAVLGKNQLQKMSNFGPKRQLLIQEYRKHLTNVSPNVVLANTVLQSEAVHHLVSALIDFSAIKKSRRQVMLELQEYGIGTQVHYIPIHFQPYYRHKYGFLNLTGAEKYYERCLSLPLFPDMSVDDVEFVVDRLMLVTGV